MTTKGNFTPKERMLCVMSHREADRVPCGEMASDYAITDQVIGKPTLYRGKWRELQALWDGRRDDIARDYGEDVCTLALALDWDYFGVQPSPDPAGEVSKARTPRALRMEGRDREDLEVFARIGRTPDDREVSTLRQGGGLRGSPSRRFPVRVLREGGEETGEDAFHRGEAARSDPSLGNPRWEWKSTS